MKNKKTICPFCKKISYIKNYDESLKKTCGSIECVKRMMLETRENNNPHLVGKLLSDQLRKTFIGVEHEDCLI